MIISDLNYVETIETSEIAGGWGWKTSKASSNYKQTAFNVGFDGQATLVLVSIDGNQADASAEAEAFGFDTYSKSATGTKTTPYSSQSGSFSTSSTDSPDPYCFFC
jgi:hypothetical protein